MRQLLALIALLTILAYFSAQTNLLDQIVALLLVGLIPFTNYVVPAFMMFFIWLLLPVGLIASFFAIKGLFTLIFLLIEAVEYHIKEWIDSRKARHTTSRKPTKNKAKLTAQSVYARYSLFLKAYIGKFLRRDTSA